MSDRNPRENTPSSKTAVALSYKPEKDKAPRIAAKGRGLVAEKIIALAKAHGVPLKDDPDLVEVLSALEIDKEIPPELYKAIAEIFVFIYQVNKMSIIPRK